MMMERTQKKVKRALTAINKITKGELIKRTGSIPHQKKYYLSIYDTNNLQLTAIAIQELLGRPTGRNYTYQSGPTMLQSFSTRFQLTNNFLLPAVSQHFKNTSKVHVPVGLRYVDSLLGDNHVHFVNIKNKHSYYETK